MGDGLVEGKLPAPSAPSTIGPGAPMSERAGVRTGDGWFCDDCRNVSTFVHFLTFGIVVKKFIVAVPFARRIASMLESEGKFLV